MSINIIGYPHRTHVTSTNVSYWNSSRQPFVFHVERKDGVFFGINDASGYAQLVVASYIASASEVVVGSKIFLKDLAGNYEGLATVTAIPVTGVPYYAFTTDIPYSSFSIGGYFNIISRINYGITAQITIEQRGFTTIKSCKVSPDSTGVGMLDIRPFINASMLKTDSRPISDVDYLDKNVFCKINLSLTELWKGSSESPLVVPFTYHAIDGVKYIGDVYGQNFADFLPQSNAPTSLGKFLTAFEQPIYFEGYPFDLAYIQPTHLSGVNCTANRIAYSNNGTTVDSDATDLDSSLGEGVHRVKFNLDTVASGASSVDFFIKAGGTAGTLYVDLGYVADTYVEGEVATSGTPVEITERKRVIYDKACGDYKKPVYLKWRNHLGAWDYFLFQNRQESDTQTKQIADYQTEPIELSDAVGRDAITSTQQGSRMTVGALVGLKQIEGIKGIERSPVVMMMTDKANNKWVRVRIVPKGFKYDTRAKVVPIELTFELPDYYSIPN